MLTGYNQKQGGGGSSAAPSDRKALIIAEAGAIGGDTLRELVINAITKLEELSALTAEQTKQLELFEAYSKLLDEHLEIVEEFDQAMHLRKLKEEELGNDQAVYEQNVDWIELNRAAKALSVLDVEKAKLTATPSPDLLMALLDYYRDNGIDILMYDGPDLGTGGTTDPELLKKAGMLPDHTAYQQLVIGGGHGSTSVLSGLTKEFVQDVILALQRKTITTNLICLGSCEGAAHSIYMHPVLKPHGMVLGYLGDCTNNFIMATVNYQLGLSDELIGYRQLVEQNEANTKSASLALLQDNKLSGFALAQVAQTNPINKDYWQDTLANVFSTHYAEYMGLVPNVKIPSTQITDITILGSEDIQVVLEALHEKGLFGGVEFDLPPVQNAVVDVTSTQPTATLVPIPEIAKRQMIRCQLITFAGGDVTSDDDFEEELDELVGNYGATKAEVLDNVSHHLPSVSVCQFAEDTRSRLIAVNHVIKKVVPPQGVHVPDPGLLNAPITPAMATQSLRLDPEDFKVEINNTDPLKKVIKTSV